MIVEDEASFWLDGTLHQTWSRIGNQPRVDTYGLRKTAHVLGATTLDRADLTYRFAELSTAGPSTSSSAMARTFKTFQRRPEFIAAHVARFQ